MLPFVARLERRRCSTANLHRLMIISNLLGTYRIRAFSEGQTRAEGVNTGRHAMSLLQTRRTFLGGIAAARIPPVEPLQA
jgi:hypothetical protein